MVLVLVTATATSNNVGSAPSVRRVEKQMVRNRSRVTLGRVILYVLDLTMVLSDFDFSLPLFDSWHRYITEEATQRY